MSESTLPIRSDPAAVDVEWLGAVLRGAGVAGRLTSLRSESVGTGQMGENVRFHLEWQDRAEDAPESVVGKFPSDDPKSRATGASQGAYQKEVRFYRDLKSTVGIRTPHCFFADIDAAGADFVMILEDLTPAVQGDQLAGCGREQAELAMDELAKLHAPRWGDETLEQVDFLRRIGPAEAGLLRAFYQGVWQGFADRYAESLHPEVIALSQRLGQKLDGWALAADGPLTLTHGDYRLDNMLFGTEEGGHPLAVVDWQTVGLGVGTGDAAYFLGASLLPETRRTHEQELLRRYHEALAEGGVRDYTWDACWNDYRHGTFGGLLMAVVASMLVVQTERGDEMFVAMASRHAAHAMDLEAESLLQ